MDNLGLTHRQMEAVTHAKSHESINNSQYQDIAKVSERTALRDLHHLVKLGVLDKIGGSGRAAHYIVAKKKPVTNPEQK